MKNQKKVAYKRWKLERFETKDLVEEYSQAWSLTLTPSTRECRERRPIQKKEALYCRHVCGRLRVAIRMNQKSG